MSILGTSTLYSPCPNCTCGRREALQNGWEMPRNLDLRKSWQWRNTIESMIVRHVFDQLFAWSGNAIRITADSCRHDEQGQSVPFSVAYYESVCGQVRSHIDTLIASMNERYTKSSAIIDLFRREQEELG